MSWHVSAMKCCWWFTVFHECRQQRYKNNNALIQSVTNGSGIVGDEWIEQEIWQGIRLLVGFCLLQLGTKTGVCDKGVLPTLHRLYWRPDMPTGSFWLDVTADPVKQPTNQLTDYPIVRVTNVRNGIFVVEDQVYTADTIVFARHGDMIKALLRQYGYPL